MWLPGEKSSHEGKEPQNITALVPLGNFQGTFILVKKETGWNIPIRCSFICSFGKNPEQVQSFNANNTLIKAISAADIKMPVSSWHFCSEINSQSISWTDF